MKLWPWGRAAQFDTEYDHEARVQEVRQALTKDAHRAGGPSDGAPMSVFPDLDPCPFPCADCGGLFVADKLKPTTLIRVFSSTKPIVVTQKFFCQKCLPTANLEIELRDKKDNNLDTAYFSTREGYLQPFSFDNVEQTLIAADEFGLLYCGDCDNLINTKRKCLKCSTPKRR